jgi:hypothetical protein
MIGCPKLPKLSERTQCAHRRDDRDWGAGRGDLVQAAVGIDPKADERRPTLCAKTGHGIRNKVSGQKPTDIAPVSSWRRKIAAIETGAFTISLIAGGVVLSLLRV